MNRNPFFKKKLAGNSQFVFLLLLTFIFSLSFIDTANAKPIIIGTSADNVGIGTTNPGNYKLNVNGMVSINSISSGEALSIIGRSDDYSNLIFRNANGTPNSLIEAGNSKFNIFTYTSGAYNNRISVDVANGSVGIGTTNPGAKLDVKSSGMYWGSGSATLLVQDDAGRGTMRLRTVSDDATDFLFDVNGGIRWDIAARGSAQGYSLQLYNASASPSYTSIGGSVLSILQSGNVGIGSTAPAFKLDVAGTGQFTQPVIVGTPTATNHATTKSYVDSVASSAAGGGITTGTSGQTLRHNGTSWIANSVLYNNGTNVGIGTAAPVTRAHVYGTLTVDPNGISNYYSEGIRIGTASNGYSVISYGANPASDTGYQANQWWAGKDGRDNGFNIWNASSGDVFHILSSGSVGVGTTNPGARLEIAGGTGYDLILNAGDAGSLRWGNGSQGALTWDTGKAIIKGLSGNALSLGAGGSSDQLYINTSGNVGIGTTALGATLDIQNSANAWATRGIRLLGPNMTTGSSLFVTVGKADSPYNMGQMYFYQAGDNSTSNRLSFGLHSVDNVLNILGTGNVGIGPTAPAYKLDVAGTGQFTQPVIVGTPTAASHAATRSYVDSAVSSIWAVNGSSIYNSNSGNVGIGTNNPGYKLDVNGVINTASGLRVAGSAPSGYYLRGNGTNFVSSAIQPGDLPSNVYNLNQTYGSHNYGYSIGNGWYKIAETTFNGNCQGSNLVGDYQDLGYTTAARYIFNISTRGECDFETNNESHHIDWNYQIDSTYDSNIDSKFRIVRTVNNTNSVKYELQVYVDTWDTGTWTFRTNGAWTIYNTQQTAGTPITSPTPKVNKLSNLNVYDGKLIAGSVGIGVTSPMASLDISSKLRFTSGGTIYNSDSTRWLDLSGSLADSLRAPGNLNMGGNLLFGNWSLSASSWPNAGGLGYNGGDVVFGISSGSGQASLAVDGGFQQREAGTVNYFLDKVGIGTASPSTDLEVWTDTGLKIIRKSNTDQILTLTGGNGSGYALIQAQYSLNFNNNVSGYPMTFNQAGSEKMRLSPAGNVGVGTTNPGARLEIAGGTGYDLILNAGDAGSLRWGNGSQGALTWDTGKAMIKGLSDNALSLGAGGSSDQLYINTSGNVGIGTVAPNGLLQVGGDLTATTLWTYGNSYMAKQWNTVNDATTDGRNGISGLTLHNNNTTEGNWSRLTFSTYEGAGGNNIAGAMIATQFTSRTVNAWSLGDLAFFTNPKSGLAERMRITSSGNVGIGSTAPTAKFNVYQTGLYDSGTQRFVDITGEFAGTSASTNTNAGAFTGIRLGYVAAGKYAMIGSVSEDPIGYARQTGLSFWTSALDANPVERMRISNVGNVGIGTTNPVSKLEVVGDVKAQSFTYGSDRNLKYNINTIDNALTKILKLRGVTFNWKSDDSKSVGLIAQEVEQVFPELVSGTEGHKGVEYGNLVGPLIEAVKEQQKEIDNLQHRVLILEKKAVKKTK